MSKKYQKKNEVIMNKKFDIEKFNIINDEENYYFFRVLEDGDISLIEP